MRMRAHALTWIIAFGAALAVRSLFPFDAAKAADSGDGIVRIESTYGVDETVQRLKAEAQFKMASEVIAPITSSVAAHH